MTRIVCGAGFLAVAMLASSAAAQQPARMVTAVGSNMNHVPSFVPAGLIHSLENMSEAGRTELVYTYGGCPHNEGAR